MTDEKVFKANVNGKDYEFNAYTKKTRNGFMHVITLLGEILAKVSWFGRTWEGFEYQAALSKAIEKCPMEDRAALKEQIIAKTEREMREKADAEFSRFKALHNALDEKNKERVSTMEMHSEDDVNCVMGIMRMMAALQSITME